ncbi:MAG: hypothetical protein ABSC05_39170 [Candidatus Solibacter sp.]|jgi:hypothetical protein
MIAELATAKTTCFGLPALIAGVGDRATHVTNGGRIEVAQHIPGHSNAETIRLYDRRNDDLSVGEVDAERIGI